MKLTHLAERFRTLVVAAGLALVASLGSTQAFAADKAKIDPMADAATIIATKTITCDPAGAKVLGQAEVPKADGSKVKANIYEVACKTGPGFIAFAATPTDIQLLVTCGDASEQHKKNPQGVVCTLPENTPPYKWLTPIAQSLIPGCDVNNVRFLGSSKALPIDFYEIGCSGKAGGVIDYPQLGKPGTPELRTCLLFEGATACQFTTKQQILAALTPLANQGDPKCQVKDVRYVGPSSDEQSTFYEFSCSNQPGFMVQAKNDNTFMKAIPCAAAAGLAGGCTLTDMGVAANGQKGYYTQTLKAAGINCNVTDYNLIGQQESSKRDYVEFKCPEKKWGLIGFVPQPGSTAGVRVNDCFVDQLSRKSCTYVTADMLKAQWDALIKLAEPTKGCDVTQVRYVGESGNVPDGVIAELACKNKRGYMATINADRTKIEISTACRLAKAHNDPEQCQIEGNGTYNE